MGIKKFIFYLFLLFAPVCFSAETARISVFEKLTSYIDDVGNKIQQATGKKLPLWDEETGIGPWAQFNGGKARLISSTDGFVGLKEVFLALQMRLDQNVMIKDIHLFLPKDSPDKITFLRFPVINQTTRSYGQDFLIPLRLKVPSYKTAWPIQINAVFDVCTQNTCTPTLIFAPIVLQAQKPHATSIQSFMLTHINAVPQDLPDKYPFSFAVKNNRLLIQTQFPDDISVVRVLLPDSSLAHVENLFIRKKAVSFDFILPDFLRTHPVLPLVFLTDRGYFYKQINLLQPTSLPHTTVSFWTVLMACFSGLFFCPFLFSCLYHKENKTAVIRQESLRMIKGIIAFFCCLMAGWLLGVQQIFNLPATSIYFAGIGLFLVWLFLEKFHQASFYFIMLVWFFMPKGFWQTLFNQNFSDVAIILICLFEMGLFLWVPLWTFYKAKQFKKIHKYMIPLAPVLKLPFYIILGLTGIAIAGNLYINQHIPAYNSEAVITALKQNKTVVVFAEHPMTITGFVDKWWALTTGKMNAPARQEQVQAFHISLSLKQAKQLARYHNVPPHLPIILVYNRTWPTGKILLNNGDYTYLSKQIAAGIF